MSVRPACACALSTLLLLGAGAAVAQQPAKPDPGRAEQVARFKKGSEKFQANLAQAARDLDKDPRLKDLTQDQRKDLVEFVTGNMFFALLHELGHAHIQEMGLPVLGREEDAADSYAVVAMLKVGTDVSHKVLVQTSRGWFLSAARNEKEKVPLTFYDEHGMDQQRAYEIICLMVGSDPDEFEDLANSVKMPDERQGTCSADYSNASWSWETVLKPHLRAPDQPKQKIKVKYGPGGDYEHIAKALRTIGMIDMLAEYAATRYSWRRPITFDVKSCGQPDLHWNLSDQTILVCYEMASDFARMYAGYGLTQTAMMPMPKQPSKQGKK